MTASLPLTRRQKQVYDCIRAYSREHGHSPTISELGILIGVRSPATVHAFLLRLEARGVIQRLCCKGKMYACGIKLPK